MSRNITRYESELPVASSVEADIENDGDLEAAGTFRVSEKSNIRPSIGGFIRSNIPDLVHNIIIWILEALSVVLAVLFFNNLIAVIPVLVLLATACVGYAANAIKAKEFHQATWKTSKETVEIIKAAIEQKPRLLQEIKCFHFQNNGNSVRQEIITFRKRKEKIFTDWYDCSPQQQVSLNKGNGFVSQNAESRIEVLPEPPKQRHLRRAIDGAELERQVVGNNRLKRIYFRTEHELADEETEDDFKEQRRQLIRRYGNRDLQYEFTQSYEVPNLPFVVMVRRTNSDGEMKTGTFESFLFSFKFYVFCILIGCAFPFRVLLEWCCVDSQIWINKKVLSVNDFDGGILGANRTTMIDEDGNETPLDTTPVAIIEEDIPIEPVPAPESGVVVQDLAPPSTANETSV